VQLLRDHEAEANAKTETRDQRILSLFEGAARERGEGEVFRLLLNF
jgi:hypothetical protein